MTLLLCQPAAASGGIIAVQSSNIKPYNDALRGFESACNCDTKHLLISEVEERDLQTIIHRAQPDLILAIGVDALNRVKSIKDIPIVYLMVLDPQLHASNYRNITGISMIISPEIQLALIKRFLPDAKRVGVLYDPLRTDDFVIKARKAAASAEIKLITSEVHSPKDVPEQLKNMGTNIDVFWMLPDITVITPETVEFLLLSLIENRIPVVTFSDKYLTIGAAMSLMVDAFDTGKQAWEITEKVLAGTEIKKIESTFARTPVVTINRDITNKLGISVSDKFRNDKDK
ncbi:MAG: ABC transporter substrate-binding protein [Nitrospirae bacterium]|nr:ABC transporter substrate-binding protein [Nitrospirota bacterium]